MRMSFLPPGPYSFSDFFLPAQYQEEDLRENCQEAKQALTSARAIQVAEPIAGATGLPPPRIAPSSLTPSSFNLIDC